MAMSIEDEIDPSEEFIPREFHPKPFRPDDIDPTKVVVSFDRRSDTLLIHLFGRGRESISVPVATYLYVMVDPETEDIVGFHIEGFLGQAVKDVPESIDLLDYAELRGITPAEVRELQRETHQVERRRPPQLGASHGKKLSVPEQRKQAIASFLDAERLRRDLSFVPAV
jgi:hypothetical protein